MDEYTIGIAFCDDFRKVLLIRKMKPKWQKGLLNFPGGKVEEDELPIMCVVRELKEECSLNTIIDEWRYIGFMKGGKRKEAYKVHMFCLREIGLRKKEIKSLTKERVKLYKVESLCKVKSLSYVEWLARLAINILIPGIKDRIKMVKIDYVDHYTDTIVTSKRKQNGENKR